MWKFLKINNKSTRYNLERYKKVPNPPTLLMILLQRTEHDYETGEYCKYKTKIALPSQYFMSFSGNMDEVVYIMASIHIHESNSMDNGNYKYYCDVLD